MAVHRQENPAVPLVFALGALCGSVVTFFKVGGRPIPASDFEELQEAHGAILLFAPDTVVGYALDAGSGFYGYSHAALYLGYVDEHGEPLLFDIHAGQGLHLRPLSYYGERYIAVVPLSKEDTEYARKEARKFLKNGVPFRGAPGGMSCSELVMACLPPSYRRGLEGFVSPNDMARAFGLPTRYNNPGVDSKKLRRKLLR